MPLAERKPFHEGPDEAAKRERGDEPMARGGHAAEYEAGRHLWRGGEIKTVKFGHFKRVPTAWLKRKLGIEDDAA